MDKKDVIAFFDAHAASWDAENVRNEAVISKILRNAGVRPGVELLDVACGTGLLIPDYLNRGVSRVLGVDISEEMIKLAKDKFPGPETEFLCADAGELRTERRFDCIVIYNAFPHFADPEGTVANLSGLLKPGGRLTVAHGASRDEINAFHQANGAAEISLGLPPADELARMMKRYLSLTLVISDDEYYQLVGRKP